MLILEKTGSHVYYHKHPKAQIPYRGSIYFKTYVTILYSIEKNIVNSPQKRTQSQPTEEDTITD